MKRAFGPQLRALGGRFWPDLGAVGSAGETAVGVGASAPAGPKLIASGFSGLDSFVTLARLAAIGGFLTLASIAVFAKARHKRPARTFL